MNPKHLTIIITTIKHGASKTRCRYPPDPLRVSAKHAAGNSKTRYRYPPELLRVPQNTLQVPPKLTTGTPEPIIPAAPALYFSRWVPFTPTVLQTRLSVPPKTRSDYRNKREKYCKNASSPVVDTSLGPGEDGVEEGGASFGWGARNVLEGNRKAV